jgi:hypothetical protein
LLGLKTDELENGNFPPNRCQARLPKSTGNYTFPLSTKSSFILKHTFQNKQSSVFQFGKRGKIYVNRIYDGDDKDVFFFFFGSHKSLWYSWVDNWKFTSIIDFFLLIIWLFLWTIWPLKMEYENS